MRFVLLSVLLSLFAFASYGMIVTCQGNPNPWSISSNNVNVPLSPTLTVQDTNHSFVLDTFYVQILKNGVIVFSVAKVNIYGSQNMATFSIQSGILAYATSYSLQVTGHGKIVRVDGPVTFTFTTIVLPQIDSLLIQYYPNDSTRLRVLWIYPVNIALAGSSIFQISKDVSFSSIVIQDTSLSNATPLLNLPQNLNWNTTYYVRMFVGGTWSVVKSFTTIPPPTAVRVPVVLRQSVQKIKDSRVFDVQGRGISSSKVSGVQISNLGTKTFIQ
jgi:hypothetical protein